jgi:predicted ATP-grasp superfamily ATP-dependent carboligase
MNLSVLFLGVGELQKNSIECAKKYNFTILGVDKNLSAKSVSLCDYFFNNDATDVVSIYEWCSLKDGCKIVCVWANNDILIPARVSLESAFKLDYPYATHQNCYDLLSKSRLSKLLSKKKITAEQYTTSHILKNNIKYPVIVKPKKGSGSKGVNLIKNKSDFEKINFHPEKQIIEEYLTGDEYGTNHFNDGENIFRLPAVRRYFDHTTSMVPLGSVMADMTNKILLNAYRDIEKIIIENNWIGPIKSDILITKQKCFIIEMSPRFHGEIDTAIIFSLSGLSIPDMFFYSLANSNKNSWKNKMSNNKIAGYISICNNRTLNHSEFIKKTLNTYGLNFQFFIKSKDKPKRSSDLLPKSTNDLVGFVCFITENPLTTQEFSILFTEINMLF